MPGPVGAFALPNHQKFDPGEAAVHVKPPTPGPDKAVTRATLSEPIFTLLASRCPCFAPLTFKCSGFDFSSYDPPVSGQSPDVTCLQVPVSSPDVEALVPTSSPVITPALSTLQVANCSAQVKNSLSHSQSAPNCRCLRKVLDGWSLCHERVLALKITATVKCYIVYTKKALALFLLGRKEAKVKKAHDGFAKVLSIHDTKGKLNLVKELLSVVRVSAFSWI